ncbi:MAG: DNA-binding protein [Bradyrhizobiaceae bacterium]|nr:MAG: DNA-binding protein [Bradyrhizobiaceae bacterium]
MHHQVESQDEVFGFMGEAATHGHAVQRIDTHAAAVFLAGERAYKIKRAVRFPFLDYGTLDKRKQACEAELEVNRPFAGALYRRVVAITREADGRLALDGAGTPAEWAVEMRRFDVEATLDRLAERREIDLALADALGRAVAAAHAGLPEVAAEPWLAMLARTLDQNDAELAEWPDLFAPARVTELGRASRTALARLVPLLRARGARGLIRRGHGDLHLGNIVLIEGTPVAFDAIEFDPLIAAGDLLYDLAFLLMDLVERGLGTAANVVLNRYLVETRRAEDLDALAALPLFLSLRAAIRAKVTAARLETAAEDARAGIARSARGYFDLACDLIAPAAPRLVAVGGLSGTGKSALAAALAPEIVPAPGAVVLRSDVERKALFGLAETERLPAEAYRSEVGARLYATLTEKARRVLAAGHSAIVDAVFARPEERAAIAAVSPAFHGLFLTADLATRVARVGGRAGDASDADAAVARRQESYDLGALDWTRVDAGGSPEETRARAMAALGLTASN